MTIRRLCAGLAALHICAAPAGADPVDVIRLDTRLLLELTRHTPTLSPPVASRAFAYTWVAAYEAVADGSPRLGSLAGQLTGLAPLPPRPEGPLDDEAVLQAALAATLGHLFANTGPTGQRALAGVSERLAADAADGLPPDVAARSRERGEAIAAHVLAWAATDGGAVVENMGFPQDYAPPDGPGTWVPTSRLVQQQAPLLPAWGDNRPFAMPSAEACPLPAPPAYSTEAGSAFRAEAQEVLDRATGLTPEEVAVARFWSDDPMLSTTPPGHWLALAAQELDAEGADAERRVEVMARLSVAMADAFIGCWHEKFRWNLVRPVTYIKATLDPSFEPLLITPPFPEYPSGHSVQSGAAAAVLTALFGENHAFEDRTHEDDGLPARAFASWDAAAEEAAESRLLGGIHFRSAIANGLDQGRCIARWAIALDTAE